MRALLRVPRDPQIRIFNRIYELFIPNAFFHFVAESVTINSSN